ncbi:BspA family leucine-rich repeat surface protein [Lactobacillus sp. R2/2]|nr:BspA family leucine-rich repeat surface protein [Lactobacillus sp. R2/2]
MTSLDLSNFDTSKVTNMSGMFSNDTALKQLNLTGWDTANVTDMSTMFAWIKEYG